MTGSTSRSLLLRARDGDEAAWGRLVELYAPLVVHWLRRFGLPEEDAADVFQEAFHAAARGLARFRRDREGDTFRGWLRTITENEARDHLRRARDEVKAAGGSRALDRMLQVLSEPARGTSERDGDEPPAAAPPSQDSLVLHRALAAIRDSFKPQTWRAFERTVLDGQAPKDVAPELGMSPGAVRVAKSRVLQRLREELGDL